jgi:hypothetical protein
MCTPRDHFLEQKYYWCTKVILFPGGNIMIILLTIIFLVGANLYCFGWSEFLMCKYDTFLVFPSVNREVRAFIVELFFPRFLKVIILGFYIADIGCAWRRV